MAGQGCALFLGVYIFIFFMLPIVCGVVRFLFDFYFHYFFLIMEVQSSLSRMMQIWLLSRDQPKRISHFLESINFSLNFEFEPHLTFYVYCNYYIVVINTNIYKKHTSYGEKLDFSAIKNCVVQLQDKRALHYYFSLWE